VDADDEGVESSGFGPIVFFADGGFCPDVVRVERSDGCPVREEGVADDVGEVVEGDRAVGGRGGEKAGGGGFGFFGLGVKLSRKKPEAAGAGGIEAAAAFGDAAFAKDEELFAGAEGFDDGVPFFEGGEHGKKKTAAVEAAVLKRNEEAK